MVANSLPIARGQFKSSRCNQDLCGRPYCTPHGNSLRKEGINFAALTSEAESVSLLVGVKPDGLSVKRNNDIG